MENWWRKVTYISKNQAVSVSTLILRQWLRLCVFSLLYWFFKFISICQCLDKSISEFSMACKTMSALIWLRFSRFWLAISTPHGLFTIDIPVCSSHFLFHAHVQWYANQLRIIGMWCACLSPDCVPLERVVCKNQWKCQGSFHCGVYAINRTWHGHYK